MLIGHCNSILTNKRQDNALIKLVLQKPYINRRQTLRCLSLVIFAIDKFNMILNIKPLNHRFNIMTDDIFGRHSIGMKP